MKKEVKIPCLSKPLQNFQLDIKHTFYPSEPQELRLLRRILDHHEFIYIIKGNAKFIYGGKEYSGSPGDLFFFKPGIIHSLISDTPGLKLVTIHFRIVISRSGKHILPKNLPFKVKIVDPCQVEDLMIKIHREFSEKSPFFELAARVYLMNLLLIYLRQCQLLKQSKSIYDFNRERINRVIKTIRENTHRRIKLAELARQLSVSSKYFSQLFEMKTNCSPGKFISQIKMEKAKKLLTSSDCPIKEIASNLGFKDVYYFCRRFKKVVGFPPAYFRRYYHDL